MRYGKIGRCVGIGLQVGRARNWTAFVGTFEVPTYKTLSRYPSWSMLQIDLMVHTMNNESNSSPIRNQ